MPMILDTGVLVDIAIVFGYVKPFAYSVFLYTYYNI
jgi:hypothetical protein